MHFTYFTLDKLALVLNVRKDDQRPCTEGFISTLCYSISSHHRRLLSRRWWIYHTYTPNSASSLLHSHRAGELSCHWLQCPVRDRCVFFAQLPHNTGNKISETMRKTRAVDGAHANVWSTFLCGWHRLANTIKIASWVRLWKLITLQNFPTPRIMQQPFSVVINPTPTKFGGKIHYLSVITPYILISFIPLLRND